jgi:hypothetical protein
VEPVTPPVGPVTPPVEPPSEPAIDPAPAEPVAPVDPAVAPEPAINPPADPAIVPPADPADVLPTEPSAPADPALPAPPTNPPAGEDPFAQNATPGYRTWTDVSGKHQVEATLVGFEDGAVRLKKTNGRYCRVLLEKLSRVDREVVHGQLESIASMQ